MYRENLKIFNTIYDEIKMEKEGWEKFLWTCADIILAADSILAADFQHDLKHSSVQLFASKNKKEHFHKMIDIYEADYANPRYAVQCFGDKIGQLNSMLFCKIISLHRLAHEGLAHQIASITQLFIDYKDIYITHGPDYEKLLSLWREYDLSSKYDNLYMQLVRRFCPEFDFFTKWVKEADLTDLRYLYYFGVYVSEDDIKTAEFLNSLPAEKLQKVMKQTAKAYIDGFAEGGKDYTIKKTVTLYYPLGMERLARYLIEEIESCYGLKVCVAAVNGGNYDQQYLYDHRFDHALYLDEDYVEKNLKTIEKCYTELKDIMGDFSGTIYFDPFGEKPFAPENKPECPKFTDEQMPLNQKMTAENSQLFAQFTKRAETSYCIIAFPTPAIGDKFTEIFDATIDINMLPNQLYLDIQQKIIDALDLADKVHIKGKGKNRTDLTVKMQKLQDPGKQTNFYNCGATQNIPVGEVFTSPQLKGTQGLLHISETFLDSLFYKELEIEFVDGRISAYSCKNYEKEEDNKHYIEENLIFPHKSLPLGEFAIGTNTLAYSVSQKYDILSLLPILIIEKMGPHFAIGDTCYTREEDIAIFNPNGKEIVSRDNEQTILRKEAPIKAYMQVHVDITLPYHEIEHITAITEKGVKIPIITNGKFVLSGTEELNKYLGG